MTETNLVALCGYKGSGKSTAALFFTNFLGAERVRFAGPLKRMLSALGLTEAEIEGNLKESPSYKLCGKSPRHAMMTLGTEWGRQMVGNDIWVNAWRDETMLQLVKRDVVTEDLRFPNEYEAVRALGGKVVRIARPGMAKGEHASEAHAEAFDVDYTILNSGDLFTLERSVKAALVSLGMEAPE